jgi:hypothetical protein
MFNFVGLGTSMEAAMAAPRLDTNGTLDLGIDKRHSAGQEAFFKKLGYTVSRRPGAYAGAVEFNPQTGRAAGIGAGV